MNYRDETWLRKKYWDEGLSLRKIAELGGISVYTIFHWMKENRIPRRNQREAISGPKNPNWNGGRIHTKQGYVRMSKMDSRSGIVKRIFEHRLVVEKALGRYLKPDELVHHINGIRDDNRLENLELVDQHQRRVCPRCGLPLGQDALRLYLGREEK